MITTALPYIVEKINNVEKYSEKHKRGKISAVKVIADLIWFIINLALLIFALYLSFKRNAGFNLGSFLMACCCSPCYIAYALAVPAMIPSVQDATTFVAPDVVPTTTPDVAAPDVAAPDVAPTTSPADTVVN